MCSPSFCIIKLNTTAPPKSTALSLQSCDCKTVKRPPPQKCCPNALQSTFMSPPSKSNSSHRYFDVTQYDWFEKTDRRLILNITHSFFPPLTNQSIYHPFYFTWRPIIMCWHNRTGRAAEMKALRTCHLFFKLKLHHRTQFHKSCNIPYSN